MRALHSSPKATLAAARPARVLRTASLAAPPRARRRVKLGCISLSGRQGVAAQPLDVICEHNADAGEGKQGVEINFYARLHKKHAKDGRDWGLRCYECSRE